MIYIDGVVAPIKAGTSEKAYTAFATGMAPVFRDHGATRVVDGWADDVPDGTLTDFRRAVQAGDGETVVFSWIEWPSREVRDAGWKSAMADPRMQPGGEPMPIEGKRMIFGGFRAVSDL